jgi:hypothetical protein
LTLRLTVIFLSKPFSAQLIQRIGFWFFGTISRAQAETILTDRSESFLIRKSESAPKDYALSWNNDGFHHALLRVCWPITPLIYALLQWGDSSNTFEMDFDGQVKTFKDLSECADLMV